MHQRPNVTAPDAVGPPRLHGDDPQRGTGESEVMRKLLFPLMLICALSCLAAADFKA